MNKQILYIFSSKLFKIVVFLVLFIFLTNTVISRFVKSSTDETLVVNLETIKKQNFDVLFMSNSYLYTTYDPLLLNSLTGLSSIHLGTSARRLCFEPFILKQVFKDQNPNLVVIDISSTTIVVPDSDRSWFFNNKAISNFNISLDKFKLLKSLIPDKRYDLWLQGLSSTTKNLYNITTEEKLKYYGPVNNLTAGKIFGYDIKIKQNLKGLENSKNNFTSLYERTPGFVSTKYNVIDEITLNKVQEVLDLAKEYSEIEFLFINNVKIDASKENQTSIDIIKNKANLYDNVKVLELNDKQIKKELDLKFVDFYDPSHVMLSGSLKVTSYFSNFLKTHYNFESFKYIENSPYIFKMKNKKNKERINVKDIKLLVAENYSTDIRVLIDSIPEKYGEVSTIVSIFPKKGYEYLLEKKSKKNKWKSDNSFRKLKNYIKTNNGYVGKLNSWSKLKPKHIDHIEMKFSGPGVLTETLILDLDKVNILQSR